MPDVHPSTLRANRALADTLPFADRQDFDDAVRGFVGTIPDARVATDDGRVVWDMAPYRFLDDPDPPDTVNPSLWRQARLNRLHGLFQVCDRIWQVRGLDIANVTFPCWWASTRRTLNPRPSRIRSTWNSTGWVGSPGRRK